MSNSKISALTSATTPLDGTETLPIVQSGATVKAIVSNIQTAPISSGTANALVYLNGTKVPTTGTVLYFNGTSLGVGTTSPTEKLTVVGNAAVSGTGYVSFERNFTPTAAGSGTPSVQFRMVTTGTTYVAGSDIGMLSDGAWSATSAPGIIRFRTTPAGSTTLVDRMRIDSAGNVGIGAIPNAWGSGLSALDMGGNSRISGNSSLVIANNAFFNGTNWIYKNTAAAATYTLNNAGIHYWATAPSGTAGNTITFVTGMTLSLAGGLSVGTTTDPGAGGFINTGNTTLGDASTDTVTVNGYMGVGGAGASTNGLQVVSTALTGAGQIGVVSSITATSSATNNARAYYGKVSTAASAFTVGNLYAVYADDATKGAGSTITNQHGLYINDQTQGTNNYGITSSVSSGTNKWNIYASGTAANYFAGTVGIGATANASALLDVQSTTKGVRMPNMTTVQKNAIATPAAGLMVFDTTLAKLCVYSGAAWQTITST